MKITFDVPVWAFYGCAGQSMLVNLPNRDDRSEIMSEITCTFWKEMVYLRIETAEKGGT